MAVLLLLLTLVVFVLFNLLPGDPARLACGKSCTPQTLDAIRHRLEYDLPVAEQYFRFLKGLFFGRTYGDNPVLAIECAAPCLGYSYLRHTDVLELMARSFPITFWLTLGGFVVWMVTGLIAGIFAAVKRGKWQDRTLMGVALFGYSMPSFFIGLILITFVVLQWKWLPFPSFAPPEDDPARFIQTMLLPWIVIAVLNAAFYVRLTRNQVLETFSEDYVRTARAKGLPERTVVLKHALRAGLTPIVTAAGLDIAYLLGGAIITESIFSLQGMGQIALRSVINSDLPIITAITFVGAAFIIIANLVVDLLYAVLDPRVRVG
jgi:peptide/nickel transport system permease protein